MEILSNSSFMPYSRCDNFDKTLTMASEESEFFQPSTAAGSTEIPKKKRRRQQRKRNIRIDSPSSSISSSATTTSSSSGISSCRGSMQTLNEIEEDECRPCLILTEDSFTEVLNSEVATDEAFSECSSTFSSSPPFTTKKKPKRKPKKWSPKNQILEQFFHQQKQYYFEIYEKQFAALASLKKSIPKNSFSTAPQHHFALPSLLSSTTTTAMEKDYQRCLDEFASLSGPCESNKLQCRSNNLHVSPSCTAFDHSSLSSTKSIIDFSMDFSLIDPSSSPSDDDSSPTLTLFSHLFASVEHEINPNDTLSKSMMETFERTSQTEKTLMRKLRARDLLYYAIVQRFPVCGLYVVGSSLNGFGNENSDMDLCLVITNGDLDQRTVAVKILGLIQESLETQPSIREQCLIHAKVPILRIKFGCGPFADLIVDLNVNNTVAVRNTHLLCYYAFYDWRVRPLVAVIKEWAKQNNINDASQSTFTSYSLVLMVLHYLQVLDDPILPSLQHLFPKRFNAKIDIRSLNLSYPLDDVTAPTNFKNLNKLTLGDLLIGFFKYYAYVYNYDKDAISVRLGREVERSEIMNNRHHQRVTWSPLCIEEPFTRFNTAHSIYDLRVFQSIKQKFVDAHEILHTSLDLSKILNVRPLTVTTTTTTTTSAAVCVH